VAAALWRAQHGATCTLSPIHQPEQIKRKTKKEILVTRNKEKLKANRQLKKDLEKQKKFLMGDVEK